MKLRISPLLLCSLQIAPVTFAASITPLWQPLQSQIKHYQIINSKATPSIANAFAKDNSDYQLQLLKKTSNNGISHYRFQQQYQGLPIFGEHLLLHKYPNNKWMITGKQIKNLDADIPSITASLGQQVIINKALQTLHYPPQKTPNYTIEKVIYLGDDDKRPQLAFHIKFADLMQHQLLLNALSGKVLKQWQHTKTIASGLGGGGNSLSPLGAYNYVNNPAGAGQLPEFEVTVNGATCTTESSNFQVRDFNQAMPSPEPFPVAIAAQNAYAVYSFNCFTNNGDSVVANGNTAASPSNDAMFHATGTLTMLQSMGVSKPIGTDLPLQIFTRLQSYDNAFSIDTVKDANGNITAHQQLVLGNGDTDFYPMIQGTVPHELCHNVTNQFGQLIYDGQSGGINESFSDLCDMAYKAYLRNQGYTWWWNGTDYTIGRNETTAAGSFAGGPLRSLSNPSSIGSSIESASAYTDGMNVHYSSGVFNKAYYNAAVTYGFGPLPAFQYSLMANVNYWVPATTFAYGACGVIQAVYDAGGNYQQMINAFNDVGVSCKLFSPEQQVYTRATSKCTLLGCHTSQN